MIELIQQQNFIIGSQKAINNLSNKNNPRLLTVSDVHGNSENLFKIITRYGNGCDALLIAGDSCKDLERLLSIAEKDLEFRKNIPDVICAVKGNCDCENVYFSEPLKSFHLPEKLILTANNQRILLTHGHNYGIAFSLNSLGLEMQYSEAKIGIFGHTHIAREYYADGYKFINPGSCTSPRGGQHPGFAIITVGNNFSDTNFILL